MVTLNNEMNCYEFTCMIYDFFRDENLNCIKNHVVAIDAIVAHGMADFIRASIKQDINKALFFYDNFCS